MGISEDEPYDDQSSQYSDDSQEDPTFDVLHETRLTFSNLSIRGKTKRHIVNGTDESGEEESDVAEVVIPKLDEKDQKSYETIQKMIEDGRVEKLKVDQCKIYLRKHGLRLTGKKETLILRIKEHINIVNGGGEEKYPLSSFVLNCKGDACTGDLVMFEQNVYEMFNIASRSANGPPCGTRIVAGRIVKESYGAAKQQHTFTIEVLWSKGEKPLPPLHPLLIKGRNLYRLKTMRQKWEDEGERHRILSEKHARGGVARLSREARIQQKEERKVHKQTRALRNEHPNRKQEEETKRKPLHSVSMKPEKLINQHEDQDYEQKIHHSIYLENLHQKSNNNPNAHVPPQSLHQSQPLTGTSFLSGNPNSSKNPIRGGFEHHMDFNNSTRISIQEHSQSYFPNSNHLKFPLHHTSKENRGFSYTRQPDMNLDQSRYPQQVHAYGRDGNLNAARNASFREQSCVQVQTCRYYAQGRCHFGDRCRYLHDK